MSIVAMLWLAAFIGTLIAALGKVPLWVPVLLATIAGLIGSYPLRQMPTLAQVRSAVDARLVTLWNNQITVRQEAYAAAHGGRYWQGLITTVITVLPNNPNDANPTLLEVAPSLNTHPTDQVETWINQGINLEATIPMALQMDVYDGPLGKGYVGTVWGRWNGNTYMRAQNHGPEDWRTKAWAQVQMPLLTSLESYWRMDEVSGARVDAIGSNTLTDNNSVTSAAGIINLAGQYVTANSEYLSHVSNASLETGATDFTFTAWVNRVATGNTMSMIGKDDTGLRDYYLFLSAAGVPTWDVYNSVATVHTVTAAGAISAAAWHFLVVDRVAGNINIYVDNGAAVTAAFAGTPNASASEFRIGARAFAGFQAYYSGLIDEVGFWKRALTAPERTALYNGGAGFAFPFGKGQHQVGAAFASQIVSGSRRIK